MVSISVVLTPNALLGYNQVTTAITFACYPPHNACAEACLPALPHLSSSNSILVAHGLHSLYASPSTLPTPSVLSHACLPCLPALSHLSSSNSILVADGLYGLYASPSTLPTPSVLSPACLPCLPALSQLSSSSPFC